MNGSDAVAMAIVAASLLVAWYGLSRIRGYTFTLALSAALIGGAPALMVELDQIQHPAMWPIPAADVHLEHCPNRVCPEGVTP